MTAVESSSTLTSQQLGLLFQYTVEAYKVFEKLAESLPNPMAAMMFQQFAVDERGHRDLIEMKAAAVSTERIRVTLGSDLIFSEINEGELSYRERAEFLIARERTMQKKLDELIGAAADYDRNLLVYIKDSKRAHVVELERELEMIRRDADWWKREDAQWRIVHGAPPA